MCCLRRGQVQVPDGLDVRAGALCCPLEPRRPAVIASWSVRQTQSAAHALQSIAQLKPAVESPSNLLPPAGSHST